jgi:hypothetical protein
MKEKHTDFLADVQESSRNFSIDTNIMVSSVVIAFLLALQDSQILESMLNIGGVSVHVLSGSLQ